MFNSPGNFTYTKVRISNFFKVLSGNANSFWQMKGKCNLKNPDYQQVSYYGKSTKPGEEF